MISKLLDEPYWEEFMEVSPFVSRKNATYAYTEKESLESFSTAYFNVSFVCPAQNRESKIPKQIFDQVKSHVKKHGFESLHKHFSSYLINVVNYNCYLRKENGIAYPDYQNNNGLDAYDVKSYTNETNNIQEIIDTTIVFILLNTFAIKDMDLILNYEPHFKI